MFPPFDIINKNAAPSAYPLCSIIFYYIKQVINIYNYVFRIFKFDNKYNKY